MVQADPDALQEQKEAQMGIQDLAIEAVQVLDMTLPATQDRPTTQEGTQVDLEESIAGLRGTIEQVGFMYSWLCNIQA